MNSAVKIILDATGGKYNLTQKALTLTGAAYRQLGGQKLHNPDRVILNGIDLKSTQVPTQMYAHAKFPNARILAFNDCNKYFVSDLLSKEKHLYPYLETVYSNTKDFGDIDIFKSDTTHLTKIYIGDKETWNNLPEIAKLFGLKDFKMYEKNNVATYSAAKYDDRWRYVYYINPEDFYEYISFWQNGHQQKTQCQQKNQSQQLQLQC